MGGTLRAASSVGRGMRGGYVYSAGVSVDEVDLQQDENVASFGVHAQLDLARRSDVKLGVSFSSRLQACGMKEVHSRDRP